MKSVLRLLIIAIFVLTNGCSDTAVTPGNANGEVRFRISNVPAGVEEILARLSRPGDTTRSLRVTTFDSSGRASGSFTDVPPGLWHLSIEGIDTAGLVRYGAEYDLEVFASEISSVVGELTSSLDECVAPAGGLVSWWTGDKTTRDRTGNNHPVWSNNVDSAFSGYVEESLFFNGVDSRLRIGDPENLKITGSLTIEGWLYVVSSPPGRATAQILFRGDDRIGLDPYWLAVMPTGTFKFQVSSGMAEAGLEAPAIYGRWLHLAATLNDADGTMTIFIDGESVATMVTSVRPFRNLDPSMTPGVGIGNTGSMDPYTHHHPFHGFIDELSVNNVALNHQQVLDLYRAGKHGKCK